MAKAPVGYDDTPMLPGRPWRVHDGERPEAAVVTPGKTVAEPPSDATILFDGSDLSNWEGRDGAPQWKVVNGYMEVVAKTGDIKTRATFGDMQLHLEFASPAEVIGDSQGRGNSGVFLCDKYEIQVLDGYDNPTYADGTTASLYGQYPPTVNACRPPGEWQTYDIFFVTPHWDGNKLVSPAYVTVMLNGVLVHHHQVSDGPTGHRNVCTYDTPHPDQGAVRLQDHGNPVRYRNIWAREVKLAE
jgi:hypothetical protein